VVGYTDDAIEEIIVEFGQVGSNAIPKFRHWTF